MKTACTCEEAVHLFLDGELAHDGQPDLFAHLAACGTCRQVMSTMMEFRRMSRQEAIHVPAAADEGVLARLEQSRRRLFKRDRFFERRPLWEARTSLSLRSVAALAAISFASGVMLPHDLYVQDALQPIIVEQPVDQRLREARLPLYVWYPGIEVEAVRDPEPGDKP